MIAAHIKSKVEKGTKLNVIVINMETEKTLEQKVREAIESCYYWDYISVRGSEEEQVIRSFESDWAVEKVMKIIEEQAK